MTSTQKAKTNMYLGLLLFLNGTLNIWQVLAAFVTAFDEFKLKLQELQGQQARQEEITKGYAVQKRNALMKMADLAYKMKGALQAFAAATGNDILFGKINWSFTDLIEGASTVKKNRSQVILNFGKEEVGNLAAYSVTEADLEALEEAIEKYNLLISSPKSVIAEREEVTRHIAELIKEIDALLKKRMDKLVSFFRLSNNSFYNTYFNERAINDPKKNFTEIYARIVNKETGETIEGALMKAIGSKGTEFTEVSNYQGIADRKQIEPEVYNLEFEMPGYETALVKNIKLSPGEKEELVVELKPLG